MKIAFALVLTASLALADETAAKVTVTAEPGRNVDVWITRARSEDGAITLKLIARGVGPKPQALTLYAGGPSEDGWGDDDLRNVTAHSFDLGGGKRGARIDVTFHPLGAKKRDEQVDTFLIGLDGKTRKLLELTTRVAWDKSKVCREADVIDLAVENGDLVAAKHRVREAALGDDDLPIDKSCRSPKDVSKRIYKRSADRFSETSEAPPPPDGGAS
jgi:hypothetical protein